MNLTAVYTSFLRHKTDLFIPIKGFELGFKDINENNQFSLQILEQQ